ncbi:hypothetical protein BO94DRAFT_6131 [Aspergillus sclerotioniger CBS 115572]|uniref:Uncharacterized protein n=1 Tax=Aspergillus sclerotioniger CBS 115572 TaxID=1450535 RepID=A0A317XET1_9EURO|nr:hypothetical protein BO94DRAFT_6131 [Aspergillus sclerotioniger CBS 115572]PWY96322.1 hypothetical protein BO94DRAFT_6131 [Aspergillus sclerotioniger CBS 115572]
MVKVWPSLALSFSRLFSRTAVPLQPPSSFLVPGLCSPFVSPDSSLSALVLGPSRFLGRFRASLSLADLDLLTSLSLPLPSRVLLSAHH